jgi:GH24 family phage-related lysozyme (muramidase)
MNPTVRAQWLTWNAQFEGYIYWMYLDIRGLVTTGVGQLIDPLPAALGLPWMFKGGMSATPSQITAEWQAVKGNHALAHLGAAAAGACTQLRLPDTAIDADALARLDRNAHILTAWPAFAEFDTWPPGAQLGLLSMAWAMGPAFAAGGGWPSFCAACTAQDWSSAAESCWMDDSHNPGLTPRNKATRDAFLSAVTC